MRTTLVSLLALACFAAPAVGAALHCQPLAAELAACAPRIAAAVDALGPQLLLELAQRRLLDGLEIAWPAPIATLTSISYGVVVRPSGPCRFGDGTIVCGETTLPLSGEGLAQPPSCFTVETSHLPLADITRLGLVDKNPISTVEAHPHKSGNALDLGDRPVDEWRRRLEAALQLVLAHLPELRPELALLLHEIVPVGWDAERHLSASYREAIGTVYLTLHPDELTLAEALVHEFQHNKANTLSHLTSLLDNAFAPLYPSPVRPDPRPLWGILLAAHAFLPVAVLYRRLRAAGDERAASPAFARRLTEIDLKNHEAIEMLAKNGRFTPSGRALFDELAALDRAHMDERASQGLALAPTAAHTA